MARLSDLNGKLLRISRCFSDRFVLDNRCQTEYSPPKAVLADGNEIPLIGLGTWGVSILAIII